MACAFECVERFNSYSHVGLWTAICCAVVCFACPLEGKAATTTILNVTSDSLTLNLFQDSTHATRISQVWTPTDDYWWCGFSWHVRQETGSRSASDTITIFSEYENQESGDIVMQYTYDASSIPNTESYMLFSFDECIWSTSGTKYGIVLTGSNDATNYYRYYYRNSDEHPETYHETYVPTGGWTTYTNREVGIDIYGLASSTISPFGSFSTSSDPWGWLEAQEEGVGMSGSDALLAWVNETVEGFKYKYPHGIAFRAVDTMNYVKDNYNTSSNSEIEIEMFDTTTTIMSVSMWEDNDIDLSGFRTLSTGIIWVIFLYWAYCRGLTIVDEFD